MTSSLRPAETTALRASAARLLRGEDEVIGVGPGWSVVLLQALTLMSCTSKQRAGIAALLLDLDLLHGDRRRNLAHAARHIGFRRSGTCEDDEAHEDLERGQQGGHHKGLLCEALGPALQLRRSQHL